MSIFSGRNPIPAPSIKLPSETLQLSSVVLGDELEIEGEGGDCLKIVSKITKDGILEKDTHHLYLKREAVVLYYTIATNKDIATNMDVDKVWNIGVVYGSGSTRETVEYPLQSQQDAFRFQRLVTGYTPHTRFRPVAAYALEQHFAPGRQATEIKSTGEVQLWCVPRPKLRSQDAPMSPLQATRTRSSTGSRAQSILSLESTLSGATVLQADKGKFVALTKARIPPLLLLFAKRDMNNGQKSFNIMRVDITNLKYRDSSPSSRRLELFNVSKTKFEIYTLDTQQAESWNLCHLRPGLFPKSFKRHKCEELILQFGDDKDVVPFKRSFQELQADALGIALVRRPVPKAAASSSGTATPRAPSVLHDTYSPPPSPILDDEESSAGWTEGSSRMSWGEPRDAAGRTRQP